MSRGRFYIRCESDEWDFIQDVPAPLPFDAAVISDRYLAEYPKGHSRFGEPRDRLLGALAKRDIPWSVDPDTARLGQASSISRQRPRAANRPLARALELPLTAARLKGQEAIDALVEAGATHQLGSPVFVSPYLEVAGVEDPRLEINLRLLDRSRQLAGDRALAGYVQLLRRDLLGTTAGRVIERVASVGTDVIFVRVRRFDAEEASTADVLAYAAVIEAGIRAGARVVADCVGRLGPVLIAAGADGFATNARCFRKVSADLHPAGGGGGAGELLWEVPGRTFALSASSSPSASVCEVDGCPAPSGLVEDHFAVRIHNLHEFQRAARLAASEGLAYATQLAQSASPIARAWARALQQLAQRAA